AGPINSRSPSEIEPEMPPSLNLLATFLQEFVGGLTHKVAVDFEVGNPAAGHHSDYEQRELPCGAATRASAHTHSRETSQPAPTNSSFPGLSGELSTQSSPARGARCPSPHRDQSNRGCRRALYLESASENRRAPGGNVPEVCDALNAPLVRAEKNLVRCCFLGGFHLVKRERVHSNSSDVTFLHQESDRLGRYGGGMGRAGVVDPHKSRGIFCGLSVPA